MALENIPIWTYPANWANDFVETLTWQTDILTSPTGAEQRRSVRAYPRRYHEFDVLLGGQDRARFDQFITSYGTADFYLPFWHDPHVIQSDLTLGLFTVPVPSANAGWFFTGAGAFFSGGDPAFYTTSQLSAVASNSITLQAALSYAWPAGSIVYPMRKARLTDQPEPTRMSDKVWQAAVQCLIVQPHFAGEVGFSEESPLLPSMQTAYRGFSVLNVQPESTGQAKYGYDRLVKTIDNVSGLPQQVDTAMRSFPRQQYDWLLRGRTAHKDFEKLLYAARGRAIPFWVPTYNADLELALDAAPGATSIYVKNAGFTEFGGPREDRRDIRVTVASGASFYRRITASYSTGGNEQLVLDSALSAGLARSNVQQISFMALARFDQDSFDIHHTVDVDGLSTCSAILRAAPELRSV